MDVEMGHAPSYLVKIGGATTCGFLIGCARLCYLLRQGLLPTYLASELVECHRFVVGNWAMGCCDTHRHFVCQIPTCTYLYHLIPTYNLCSVGTKTHANCQAPFFHHVCFRFPNNFQQNHSTSALEVIDPQLHRSHAGGSGPQWSKWWSYAMIVML